MITSSVIVGLVLLTILIIAFRLPYVALALSIPAVYCGYLFFVKEYSQRLGYPIDMNIINRTNATFFDGREINGRLYLFVLESGNEEPRIISMPATDESRKKMERLKQKTTGKQIVLGRESKPLGGLSKIDGFSDQDDGLKLENPDEWLPSKDGVTE